ncbi:MAG TPA: hypothetical protein VGA21_13600 [Cyclobacteriaceae bacterium]|jgi:hypothetical protein
MKKILYFFFLITLVPFLSYSQQRQQGSGDISLSVNLVTSSLPMKMKEYKDENLIPRFFEFNFEKWFKNLSLTGSVRTFEASKLKWAYRVSSQPLNIDHISTNFELRRVELNLFLGARVNISSKFQVQVQTGIINSAGNEIVDVLQYAIANGILMSGEVHSSKNKTYYDFGGQANLLILFKVSQLVQINLFGGSGMFVDGRTRIEGGVGTKFSF